MNDPTQIFIGNQELTINKNITQIVEVVQEWEKNKKFIDFFEKTCIVAGSKVTFFLTLIFNSKNLGWNKEIEIYDENRVLTTKFGKIKDIVTYNFNFRAKKIFWPTIFK